MYKHYLALLLAIGLSFQVLGAIDTYHFDSVEKEQQYRTLTEQLRCPKCQNNSIADSNAIIAGDMRQKVYELMSQGYSKQQIIDYMVARYGNFVSYQPPVTPATLVLWLGPVLFILVGAAVIMLRSRRRKVPESAVNRPPHVLDETEKQRLAELLHCADKEQSS